MLNFIAIILKMIAAGMLISGAIVASQSKLGASEILLIVIALTVSADILRGIGGMLGNNNNTESTLP
jgi:hypothetical protein